MKILTLVLLTAIVLPAFAAEHPILSGNPGTDLFDATATSDTVQPLNGAPRKSEMLAVVASAILPGAGQAYVGNWWRAAAFFAVEVAGVTAALMYTHAGDNQTTFFQNYADANIDATGNSYTARWDVVRYAEFINKYLLSHQIDSAQIPISSDQSKAPWDRVDWNALNTLEKKIGDNNATSGFSHTLPPHGYQQYYEEIGKYPQYGQGWDDVPASDLGNSEEITPHLNYYSAERGKANTLYTNGTWATIVVILNHVASAIDAAISSHSYNKALQVGFVPESYADGRVGIRPQVDLRILF